MKDSHLQRDRVKETLRVKKARTCLFVERKDPVVIYRTYYLRSLFYMIRKKTRIFANRLPVAIIGGEITRLFEFSSLCSSAFNFFLTCVSKFFEHIFL